jgi:protein phosphatase
VELEVGQGTHTGMIRAGNEDSYFSDLSHGLFVVADGMGGHAAGEVASEMAVHILSDELRDSHALPDEAARQRVEQSLQRANQAIYQRTLTEVDKQGMGTTVCVLLIRGGRYLIGHVGDSRIYMLRDGALRQLTKDHSYVQEQVDAGVLTPEQARYHPYSNVITRCVGANTDVQPDVYAGEIQRGDTFLVASDGLTGMVDDRRLQQLLQARASAQRVVDALIAEANGRGGLDNITAIVVRVVSVGEPSVGASSGDGQSGGMGSGGGGAGGGGGGGG